MLQNIFKKKRLSLIFQTERTDCALSCITMIANYYGIEIELVTLKQRYPEYKNGMNLNEIRDILETLKMNARVLSVDNNELDKVKLPCIIHWDKNHFVVLKKIYSNKFVIHDPEKGIVTLSKVKFFKHFNGIVIEPTLCIISSISTKEEKLSSQKQKYNTFNNLCFLFLLIKKCQSPVFFILLLLLIIEFANICLPQITQLIIDDAIVNSDLNLLIVASSGYFILSLIQLFVSSAKDGIIVWINAHLGYYFPVSFYNKLMSLPVSFFNSRNLGDLISRFDSIDTLKNIATMQLLNIVLDIIMMSASFVMLVIYDKYLALIILFTLFLYAVIKLFTYNLYRIFNISTIKAKARQNGSIIESVKNHQLLKLYPECNGLKGNYTQSLVEVVNNQAKASYIQMFFTGSNLFLSSLKNIAILYFGGRLVMSGTFSIGMLVAFIAYSEQFCRRTIKIIDFMMQSYISGIHIARINEVMGGSSKVDITEELPSFVLSTNASLKLKNVSFEYNANTSIFSDISIELGFGETLLISGRSGCGKSTLAKLILGLLPLSTGRISYNDITITPHNIKSFRKLTGTVLQGDSLLNGTLLYNITFDNSVSIENIISITEGLGIHGVINNLPMGYYSQVTDINTNLSVGQIQRILLARAIYRKPALLILDEATSNLDCESEKQVINYIASLPCTKILISHKGESYKIADKILILDKK